MPISETLISNVIYNESAETGLKKLPEKSVQCCVTSPPYYCLRDYGHKDQIGLEETPEIYIENLVRVFREVKRVLKDDGVLWVNIGDSYCANATGSQGNNSSRLQGGKKTQVESGKRPDKKGDGLKPKDLIGIPWMLAFALRADGWYLRQDIIWSKPNPMPESVTDRCTKSHEYIFLLSKLPIYYYDHEAIFEKATTPMDSKARCGFGSKSGKCDTMEYSHSNDTGKRWEKTETRNKRSVWSVATKPYKDAHFAVFPPDLIVPCIKAGSRPGDIIIDPFFGSGTTGEVSLRLERKYIGFEINPEYIRLAEKRLKSHKNQLFNS